MIWATAWLCTHLQNATVWLVDSDHSDSVIAVTPPKLVYHVHNLEDTIERVYKIRSIYVFFFCTCDAFCWPVFAHAGRPQHVCRLYGLVDIVNSKMTAISLYSVHNLNNKTAWSSHLRMETVIMYQINARVYILYGEIRHNTIIHLNICFLC